MTVSSGDDTKLAAVLARFSQAVRDQTEGVTAHLLASKLFSFRDARLKPLRDDERRIMPSATAAAKRSRGQRLRRLARRASR